MSNLLHVWNDPKWVARTPLLTVGLFESANVGQIIRMVTHHTAGGQSIISWAAVNVALWLWLNFYRVMDDHSGRFKWAARTIRVGIILNAFVIATVGYYRMTGRG